MSSKSNKLTALKVLFYFDYVNVLFKILTFIYHSQQKAITNFKDLEQGVFYKIGKDGSFYGVCFKNIYSEFFALAS